MATIDNTRLRQHLRLNRTSARFSQISRDAEFVVRRRIPGSDLRPGDAIDKTKFASRLLRQLHEQRFIDIVGGMPAPVRRPYPAQPDSISSPSVRPEKKVLPKIEHPGDENYRHTRTSGPKRPRPRGSST